MEFPEARVYEEAMNILLYEQGSITSTCPSCSQSAAGTPTTPVEEVDRERASVERIEKAKSLR